MKAIRDRASRRLAALIINWNGAEDTLALVQSLNGLQSDNLSMVVVIIDNCSAEKDRALLEEGLGTSSLNGQIIYRANSRNIGVPAAYNQAIQLVGVDYDYYLRLDNDVIVDQSGLYTMMGALDEGAESGILIVGGNIKYFDHPSIDNGGAVAVDLMRGVTSVSYPERNTLCDSVLGCIVMLSGQLVRLYAPEVFHGPLFLCTDESELSLKARRDGTQTLYLARMVGYHKSGMSTSKVPAISRYYSARNWTFLRLKYSTRRERWKMILFWMPRDVIASVLHRRWVFILGFCAGIGWSFSNGLDGIMNGKE